MSDYDKQVVTALNGIWEELRKLNESKPIPKPNRQEEKENKKSFEPKNFIQVLFYVRTMLTTLKGASVYSPNHAMT